MNSETQVIFHFIWWQFVKATCLWATGKMTNTTINPTLFGIAHHLIVSYQDGGRKKKVLTVLLGTCFHTTAGVMFEWNVLQPLKAFTQKISLFFRHVGPWAELTDRWKANRIKGSTVGGVRKLIEVNWLLLYWLEAKKDKTVKGREGFVCPRRVCVRVCVQGQK